jgi:hypothetical protein
MKRANRSGSLVLVTAVVVALASGLLGASALAASTTVRNCSAAQLRLKFVDMQGATGHTYIDYAFEDVAPAKCKLRGYPGAVLLNKHGQTIASPHAQVGQWPLSMLRTVVLGTGQPAFFTFTWVGGGFCPSAFTFYGLRVTPPPDATGFQWQIGNTSACVSSAWVSAVRPKLFPF